MTERAMNCNERRFIALSHSSHKKGKLQNMGRYIHNLRTETPVDYVYVQCEKIQSRQFSFAHYGLAFFESSVRKAKGNPVMYFESDNFSIRDALDSISILPESDCRRFVSLMALYEGFSKPLYANQYVSEIDFRWEREWRVSGDFNFGPKDIAFGICPQNEIEAFEELSEKRFLFVDPHRPIGLTKKKLREDERLTKLI